jgi:Viral BACON domain/Putative binding domain, N-terminal
MVFRGAISVHGKRIFIMWCGLRRLSFSFHLYSIAAALAVVAAACGESGVTQTTGPGPVTRCQTALTGLPTSLAPSAARLTATVSTNRECQWTIESEESWVRVTPESGQGEASVSVVVAENPAAIARSAALVVNGSRVAVSQQAAACRFELPNASTRVPAEGGPFSVSVSTIPGCKWSASSEVSWVRVGSSELTGSGNASFVADANTTGERSGTLTLAGLSFLVQQAATPPAPAPSPSPAPSPTPGPPPSPSPTPGPTPSPSPTPGPTPGPRPTPLTLVSEPSTMPIGYLGERFAGLRVRARGGVGPYRITGTNLLGWPSSLDYKVDTVAGTADWHGTVTRTGEFPVRMVVEDSAGTRAELMLTFVFKPAPVAPLTLVTEPGTMPTGYLGERFPGLRVRVRGGAGPYRITGTNLLGWPSSLDYKVDAEAGTADWHGTVTRTGEFPVRMSVEDSTGARGELMLTFVFKPAPTADRDR